MLRLQRNILAILVLFISIYDIGTSNCISLENSVLGLKAFGEDHVRTCFNIRRCLHRLSQLQDANRCCQMLSMLQSCNSYCILFVFNVWGRCSFHSLVETFTRPGWWESDFRKETSQAEWSFDYCQMSTLIWYAVYRLAYNHHHSYLDCIERDRGDKSTPTPKMQSFGWGWCQFVLDSSWWQVWLWLKIRLKGGFGPNLAQNSPNFHQQWGWFVEPIAYLY